MSNADNNSSDKRNSFAHFERDFQEKIVQAMLTDRVWAAQIAEVIDIEYFEYAYLRLLSGKYFDHYQQYKEFPSLELMVTIIKEDLINSNDKVLADQIVTVLKNTRAKKDLGDLGLVKDLTLKFCRQQGFKKALIDCTQLIDTEEHYDRAVEIVKKAISAGQVQSPGMSLEDDIEARYSETFRETIKTNIQTPSGNVSLDERKFLNGGTGNGELYTVIANSGVGKSHVLVHIGAEALSQGKNVLHFSMELRERAIGVRYDSHLLKINSLDCPDYKFEIKKFYQENAGKIGKLRIKEFPTGTATVNTLRAFIDKLALENFRPDLLVVDYAGIMRSSSKYELERLELKKIYEELRGLAQELDLGIWTACQSNREGADAEIITMKNMAESYAQSHICDFVMGFGRPEAQKATGFGTLFVAKNRNGIDGVQFKVKIDTAQSRLVMLSEDEIKNVTAESQKKEEDEMNFVRRTYKELNTKKILGNDTGLELQKVSFK